jgi:hypothetical protein
MLEAVYSLEIDKSLMLKMRVTGRKPVSMFETIDEPVAGAILTQDSETEIGILRERGSEGDNAKIAIGKQRSLGRGTRFDLIGQSGLFMICEDSTGNLMRMQSPMTNMLWLVILVPDSR